MVKKIKIVSVHRDFRTSSFKETPANFEIEVLLLLVTNFETARLQNVP